MRGDALHLGRRKLLAEAGHRPLGIAAARTQPPRGELRLDIRRGLAGDGGDSGAALASVPMAGSASALVENVRCGTVSASPDGRQRAIILRHRQLLVPVERARYGVHLRMRAQTLGVEVKLTREIARVEPGKRRRAVAIAFTLDPVTSSAGAARAIIAARQSDQLSSRREPRRALRLGRASGEERRDNGRGYCPHVRWNQRTRAVVPGR